MGSSVLPPSEYETTDKSHEGSKCAVVLAGGEQHRTEF